SPTVAIAANQTSVCAGSTVTFTATGANAGSAPVYTWFRNGLATATGAIFTLTPAYGDAISARVTAGGTLPTCLSTSTAISSIINIMVSPLLNATVAVVPSANPICAGTGVTFTATPTNGGTTPTYRWTVNNALQAGSANTFTYVPANGDVVKAVVQVGGTGNACMANTSATSTGVTINVNGTIPASVSVSASTLTYCAGNTAIITASATGTGSAPVYRWYVNNVAQANATNTFSFVPSNSDVVKVVMTPGGNGLTCVTGGTSTSNGLSFVVNQNVTPSVSIVSSGNTICAGSSVAFSATGVNLGSNPTISWSVNGNAQATGATFAYQPANGDVIQVNATAGGTLPTCLATTSVNSNSISITVNPNLTASVSVNASATSICSGTGISLTATGVNAGLNATYTWIKNGTVFSTGNTLSDVPSYGDAYAVMVTVGSSSACMTNTTAVSSVISPSVSICPLPNPGSIAGPNFVATGTNNVVYTVPNVTGDSYLWTVPSGATIVSGQGTNAITVSFGNTVATGDITLAQTNANGTTTVSKSVTTGNVPGAVTITGPTTVDPNQTSIVYSVTSVTGTSYQWTV
ncbi:MAG: hypothetical protein K2Q22_14770, partial [Cytophagales bacterium]|nr:hypothetical protein [Cytophagales bacterium]